MKLKVVAFPAFRNRYSNPYNALLYENMVSLTAGISDYHHLHRMPRQLDIIHVHWPDLTISGKNLLRVIGRSVWLLARLALGKLKGAKVIWTVHNLAPHDHSNQFVARIYWKLFFHLLDGAIFLSKRAREQAFEALPALRSKPNAVIPHGHYRPVLLATDYLRGRAAAREKYRLPQDSFIYLYFGQIRDYKNVELLVEEFLALGETDALLLIAGSCGADEERAERLRQIAASHDSIHLDLQHVPEEVLFEYLEASNLVVLPYKRILNSGSVMMALSATRPVLAPNVGSIIEVGEQVGGNWLIRYDGDFNREALAAARRGTAGASEPLDLGFFDWQPIAQQTVDFYRRVRDGG